MALQKQPFAINLGGTLDTKTDQKQVIPGNFTVLENAIFTRPGSLEKRNGLSLLSNVVDYSQQQITQGQATSVFQDQLLLFTGEEAFSRLAHNDKWTAKGEVSSIINETFQVVRNPYSQDNPDGNKIDNVECYVWEDFRGGIRYSIIDSQTGNFIVSDELLSATGLTPKVLTLRATDTEASQFVIIFGVDRNLCMVRIFTNTLTLPPVVEYLANDMNPAIIFDACSCFSKQYFQTFLSQEFNSITVAYAADFDVNAGTFYQRPVIRKITPTNHSLIFADITISAFVPEHISVTPTPDLSVSGFPQMTAYVMWHSGSSVWLGKVNEPAGTMPFASITLPPDFYGPKLKNLACIWDGKPFTDQLNLKLFFEFENDPNLPVYQYCRSATIQISTSGITVSPMDDLKLKKGIGLYSKPFLNNGKIYITTIHYSELQPTYFVVNESLEVVSKINQLNAGGFRTSQLAQVFFDQFDFGNAVYNNDQLSMTTPVGNGIFHLPTLKKGKIDSESNTIFSLLGVTRSTLDFISPNHFISSTINDNLYVVGGVLQNYDGDTFTEAGFHLYPEEITYDIDQIAINVVAVGSAVTAQSTQVTFFGADRIKPGDYFTIAAANNSVIYYGWFSIEGVGVDPQIPGLTGIQINIQSYFTGPQVSEAIIIAMSVAPDFTVAFLPGGNPLVFTNVDVGITDGFLPGTLGLGDIDPGTYSYVCLWKYIDNAGRIHRSATSIPLQVIVPPGGNSSVSISVPLLSPTAKTDVVLEVYRTENLGSLYRRVTSLATPVFNTQNQDPNYKVITFIDTTSDADAQANELLYTTGDVLNNDSPPPCSLIQVFKNRLFIAGLDDKNLIQYSKIIDPGDKQFVAGFSDALYIQLDTRGGNITALATMDDKLVVFKETQIFYITGDGPNNTGSGGDFGDAQQISTDVGCDNPNSVVLTPNGLMFKSPKGIYLLDRGLNVTYIGAAVERYNHLTISSSVLLNNKNQVRFMTEDGSALIYDYYVQKWTTFTNYESVDCDIYNGEFVMLRSNGNVQVENSKSFQDQTGTNSYLHIPLNMETANIATAGLIGFQRIYRVLVLGEYKGEHMMKVSLSYNYDPNFTSTAEFDATDIVGSNTYGSSSPYGSDPVYGGFYAPYMFRVHLAQQKCAAIRIRLEDIQTANFNEGLTISSIVLEVGVKSGINKLPNNKSLGST